MKSKKNNNETPNIRPNETRDSEKAKPKRRHKYKSKTKNIL